MKNNYISSLHFISKHLVTLMFIALLFIGVGRMSGATITVSTNTNWSALSVGVGDIVYVRNGATLTVNVSTAACASLQIGGTTSSGAGSLVFSGTNPKITVSGLVQVGGWGNTNRDGFITFTNTATIDAGSVILGGIGGTNAQGTINMTAGGTLRTGSLTVGSGSGTWTQGTGTVILDATNTLPATIFTNFNNLSTDGTGTTTTGANLTIGGNLAIGDGTTFRTATTNNLTVTGTTTVGGATSGILNLEGWSGTRIFTGLVTVNPGGTWNNSGNLAVNFRGGITNNGTFTVGTGTQTFNTNPQSLIGNLDMSGAAVTVTGITLTNNGTLTLSSNFNGTGTLINAGTVNTTAQITISTVTNQGTLNASSGNLTPTTLTNTSSGILNISGDAYTSNTTFTNQGTLNYTSSKNINQLVTNTGTINVQSSGYIASITNSTGGTLNISTLSYNINTLTATASGNTVNYSGAGDQTIKNVTYSNLTLSGSGTKSFTTAATINNNFTINTGAVANLSNILTHKANAYYLDAVQQYKGSWGSSASSANNFDDTNFALPATGILTVAAGPTPPVPAMWYKADIGPNTTTNGTGITKWNDQSGSANNATSQKTAPTYQTLGWNFNPSISFSAGYFLTASNNIFNDMTFFGVFNTTQTYSTNASNAWSCPTIIGGETNGPQSDYFLSLNEGKPFFKAFNGDSFGALSPTAQNDGNPRIISATRTKSTSGTNYIYINGIQTASGTSDDITLNSPTQLGIGNHFGYQASAQFNGGISEIIGNSSVLTASDRQNFESYLAIKYGITLTHNYTNSAATSIYPIAGYNYDIAGLGRNETWKLHQKVSASSNMASGNSRVVMATSNDFVNSNLDGNRTALTNGQYLIWGHNNGSTSTWTAIGSTTPRDSIINRVWKVVNTANVGSVYFQIDLTGYTAENGIYRLLVDNNTDFTTGATSYTLTNTSGNLYTTNVPVIFANGVRYFTIGQKSNYWKGTSTSTDWGTDANWTAGEVPPTGAKVEYATVANSGVVAANNLVLDLSERTVSRVINATTWNLTIPAGKALTVTKNITTDGNPDRILIKTDPTADDNTRLPNGSLIFRKATNVNATVEMYSKANITALPSPYKYNWQFFGIPLSSVSTSPTFDGSYVRIYKEERPGFLQKWLQLQNGDELQAFKGYEITHEQPKILYFQGQLVNADLTDFKLTVTPYGTMPQVFFRGQHLLSNPYTAAIDVRKIVFGANTENTVYLHNTGSVGNWTDNNGQNTYDETAKLAGQYLAIPQRVSGATSGLPNDIPSMSSFLVKATDTISTVNPAIGSITIKYSDVIIKNINVQRVKSADEVSNTDLISTKIDLIGLHFSDRMWIFTEPTCTKNFDNGWDGRKMLGSSLSPQIYAVEPDGDYQVNSVADMHNTDLAFQPGDELEYTLKFTHENIQRLYAGVYLVDLIENKTIDITQSGSTYKFATASANEPTKRFKIITRPYEKNAPDAESLVKIFTSPTKVFIQNSSTFRGECRLYDISGRAINLKAYEPSSVTEVFSDIKPGAYVVSTLTNGEKVSKRIIIQ